MPSDVTLNQGEGLRAAFYTDLDPASYASFKAHVKQIDILFPEWLHVLTPDGSLTAFTSDNTPFAVVDSAGVHGVDRENKILHTIQARMRARTSFARLTSSSRPTPVIADLPWTSRPFRPMRKLPIAFSPRPCTQTFSSITSSSTSTFP